MSNYLDEFINNHTLVLVEFNDNQDSRAIGYILGRDGEFIKFREVKDLESFENRIILIGISSIRMVIEYPLLSRDSDSSLG